PAEAALERLLAAPHNDVATLYLSAEATTPVAKLIELTRGLPNGRPIALASVLPLGTHVPPAAARGDAQLCSDALPEPAAKRAEGELSANAIMAEIGPLREDAQRCFNQAVGGARAGGRLTLAFRIAEHGEVETACLVSDSIGSPDLASCVTESARKLRFPNP